MLLVWASRSARNLRLLNRASLGSLILVPKNTSQHQNKGIAGDMSA